MARNKTIKILRTTRANLNTQKNANALIEGEPYLITDERRLAVGIGNNDYEDFAKKSEVDAKKSDNVSTNARIMGRKTAGSGVIEELTLSEVLDFIGSATQGDILYRGASSWARLPKGTDGQVLTLANGLPSWAAGGGGGSAMKYCMRTTDFVNNQQYFVDISGLSFSVEANKKYLLIIFILAVDNDYIFEDSASAYINIVMPTGNYSGVRFDRVQTNATHMVTFGHTSGNLIINTLANSTQYVYSKTMIGILSPTANGTVKLQAMASHSDLYGIAVKSGSYMILQEVIV